MFNRLQKSRVRSQLLFSGASELHFSRLSSALVSCFVLILILLTAFSPAWASKRVSRHKSKIKLPAGLTAIDNDLLDDISRRSIRYFWEQPDLRTGLVLDRARTNGQPEDDPFHRNVASIAATGFGLTALCIAADHRWVSPELVRQRVLTTLRFFAFRAPQEHGWFYHYMDATSGERRWKSEVSSIDTALLLAGILTTRQAFHDDPEIARLATAIYNRVDFQWMLNGSYTLLSHGWTPEKGFLPYRWDTYSEQMILYVLAIGSPTHPISPASWYAWKLPVVNFGGFTYVGQGPLFVQQYSQAWLDLRGRGAPQAPPVDYFTPRVDYFANSVTATHAQQALGVDLSQRFPGYSSNVWGITASDSARGYVSWGASPLDPRIDGTVVPSAAAGSLMFARNICIPALRTMLVRYSKKIYGRYGFADAFNPTTGWVSRYVLGIDAGITLLSAENLRTGKVWNWFMSSPEPERALNLVGLIRIRPLLASSNLNDNQKRDAETVPRNPGSKTEPSPEIPISFDTPIPVSDFEFKIPIPPLPPREPAD